MEEPAALARKELKAGRDASRPVQPVEPFTLVVFGGTGDLASRKLLPALFSLWSEGFLPDQFAIVGVGRREKDDSAFRAEVRDPALSHCRSQRAAASEWERFASRLFYRRADATDPGDFRRLKSQLEFLEANRSLTGNRLYYLAIDPAFFAPTVEHLSEAGLLSSTERRPWHRIVIEKPFGRDLASAQDLDRSLLRAASEEQIFRIDHYLGKETVLNVMAFRFGNATFEPLFNRQWIDHVQITAAESLGMEGGRGSFYDRNGALRDMVQNHLLQVLALIAMEPPAVLKAKEIRDEKVKILGNLVPLVGQDIHRCVVRGQYGKGEVDGNVVRGYRQEEGVAADSSTETYAALRVQIDTWRWAGVPFLLRTGKRLPRRQTEVVITFKMPPLHLFTTVECHADICSRINAQPNVLVLRLQPEEGISLAFSAKRPGMDFELQPVRMEFRYGDSFSACLPEAYERLLLDALLGDATLFMRSDEVDAAWRLITPILEAWQEQPTPSFPNYAAGSWGPGEAEKLTQGCQQGWVT